MDKGKFFNILHGPKCKLSVETKFDLVYQLDNEKILFDRVLNFFCGYEDSNANPSRFRDVIARANAEDAGHPHTDVCG